MAGNRTPNVAKIKHKKFIDEMLKNGLDKEKAYQTVYPNASDGSARVLSSRLINLPETQEELARRCASITPEYITDRIHKIADGGKKEDTRLRALEMLAKIRSLFKSEAPSQQINVLAQFDTPEARKDLQISNNQPSISETNNISLPNTNDCNDLGNSV